MAEYPKPALRRMVIFTEWRDGKPADHPAVVTRVWSETCVNLQVLFDCALPEPRTSVPREDATPGANMTWRWDERPADGTA